MNDGAAEQSPAGLGLLGDLADGDNCHGRVMFERHRRECVVAGTTADDTDEGADAANVDAPGEQAGYFLAYFERFGADANVGHQPPVTGGKKATSSPSPRAAVGS